MLTTESKTLLPEVLTWTSGPSICAHFHVTEKNIRSITLSRSSVFSCTIDAPYFLTEIMDWMSAYAQKQTAVVDLPLDLSSLSLFTKKGLEAIQSIPFGEVASYGEIAARAGCEKGARAIGNVCNKNPYPLIIPCHRVIQGDGSIGGFGYPLEMKRALLAFESD